MTDQLSPAAQAVLDAVALAMEGGWISPEFIPYEARKAAAILRAAANQIGMNQPLGETDADAGVFAAHNAIKHWLLAIVAELEARP